MSEVPAVVDGDKPEVRKRGPYRVSGRLARCLTLLASGECRTQVEACAKAGLSPRALQLALKRESVRRYMQQEIMGSLNISALKAAKTLDLLLGSSNEIAKFQSARYCLAVGANIQPPERSGPLVNINLNDVRAGFVIDLSEGDRDDRAVVRPVARGPVIESEAIELDDVVK